MNLAVNQSLLLINCLERFEKQSNENQNRNELVELFCTQAIPFLAENSLIDELRKGWVHARDQMNLRVKETEAKAWEKLKETADAIRISLGVCPNKTVTEKTCIHSTPYLWRRKVVWHPALSNPLFGS